MVTSLCVNGGASFQLMNTSILELNFLKIIYFEKKNETKGQLDLEVNWYLTIDFKLCHPKLEVNQHLTTSSKLDYLELDQNWV
jgi:hypothetical protein